ncbi:hypothetical protein LZ190_08940 [Rhodovulum sulfidophilum]|nr:hypothetical protein [Rhodovulum sulfidophilum]
MLIRLRELGFAPGVISDANARSPLRRLNLQDRYLHDPAPARHLALRSRPDRFKG